MRGLHSLELERKILKFSEAVTRKVAGAFEQLNSPKVRIFKYKDTWADRYTYDVYYQYTYTPWNAPGTTVTMWQKTRTRVWGNLDDIRRRTNWNEVELIEANPWPYIRDERARAAVEGNNA